MGDEPNNSTTKSGRRRTNLVYVIGGGIAGLTAAHELIERGFRVHVFEKLARPFDESDCEVGGLSRTQWSSEVSTLEEPFGFRRAASLMGSVPRLGEILVHDIPFEQGSFALSAASIGLIDQMTTDLKQASDAWLASIAPLRPSLGITVEGYAPEGETPVTSSAPADALRILDDLRAKGLPLPPMTVEEWSALMDRPGDSPARRLSRYRAFFVGAVTTAMLDKKGARDQFDGFFPVGLGDVPRSFPDEPLQGQVVRLRLGEMIMPGEHGYRYFPAFYRHVMDTMRRIPLFESSVPPRPRLVREVLEAVGLLDVMFKSRTLNPDQALDLLIRTSNLAESPRTVFDNLVPTYQFAIATGDGAPPIPISRVLPSSFAAVRRLLSTAFTRLGMNARDMLRFQLKLLTFLTSCRSRRQGYERLTWAEFIGADRCSERFQALIERWPQALVGVRASLADARTIGTVTAQLLLDQSSTTGYRDGTLNGPTTRAFLDPWRRYLEARGVHFWRGEARGLALEEGKLKPTLEWKPRRTPGADELLPPPEPLMNGYVVLALPPLEAKRLVTQLWASCDADAKAAFPRSLLPLLRWPLPPAGAHGGLRVEKAAPSGTLRHYSGIQFYLGSDLGPAQGHIYVASSDWRLSAISQVQFWQQRLLQGQDSGRTSESYYSILSVDIGDWHAPSARLAGRCAAECTRQELAEEVWRQIEEGLAHDGWMPPRPFAFHVDDDMLYEDSGPGAGERPVENLSPYPVNLAGDWDNHPGSVEGYAYEMFEGLVLAGSYVKTRTRLTTMESANESARRAVNAILDDYAANSETLNARVPARCQLWDPEDYEIDDLGILKEIDAKLMEQGLPHMFEILDVEKLLDGDLGALDPAAVLDAILGSSSPSARAFAAAGAPIRLIRALLEALF